MVCCVAGKNLYNNEHVAVKLVSFNFNIFLVFRSDLTARELLILFFSSSIGRT